MEDPSPRATGNRRAAVTALVELAGAADGIVRSPSARTVEELRADGIAAQVLDVEAAAPGSVPLLVLADDELSRAGERAEVLVDHAARALRQGADLVICAAPANGAGLRSFDQAQLTGTLHHRGFTVRSLRSTEDGATVALARAPRDEAERSAVFFRTLPRKVIASAAICVDDRDRLLIVHDEYRGVWTIPGGVVDPDESPADAARRETWEEAGVRVEIGALLGMRHYTRPDRLVLLHAATVVGDATPAPVHTHEVGEARWAPLAQALELLNPRTREQVRSCLGRC